MTYNVSITGIDGCGKSSSIENTAFSLSKNYNVAVIGRPTYILNSNTNEKKYLFNNLNNSLDKMHSLADDLKFKFGVAGVKFLNTILSNYANKNILDTYSPQITLHNRDKLIDVAVYSTFYFPFTRNWSCELRLKLSRIFSHTNFSNHIIYYQIDPNLAIERINGRFRNERLDVDSKNKKWIHMHENLENLILLKNHYLEALNFLSNKSNLKIDILDINNKNLNEVSQDLEDLILTNFNKN